MINESRCNFLKTYYSPSKTVKFSDILAIADKESSGVEYFTSKDQLFWQNIRAAEKITGLSQKDILDMVIIPSTKKTIFQEFMFNAFNVGEPTRYIKFRCEPSIFALVKNMKEFSLKEKFLLGCSVGIGQRLLYYWLGTSKKPKSEWIKASKDFAVDLQEQIKEMEINMSWWFLKANKNRELAFSYYNAGGGIKKPTPYGIAVNNLSKQYKIYD